MRDNYLFSKTGIENDCWFIESNFVLKQKTVSCRNLFFSSVDFIVQNTEDEKKRENFSPILEVRKNLKKIISIRSCRISPKCTCQSIEGNDKEFVLNITFDI